MVVSLIKCHKVSGQLNEDLGQFLKLSICHNDIWTWKWLTLYLLKNIVGPSSHTWRLLGIIIWKPSSKERKTKTAYLLPRTLPRTYTIPVLHLSLLLAPVYVAMTKSKEKLKKWPLYSVTVAQLSVKSFNHQFYILLP